METLKTEQQRIYERMRSLGARGFLRVCREDDALWVSDAARRECSLPEIIGALENDGIRSRIDGRTGLWYLDWSDTRWEVFVGGLPSQPPAFPKDERLHDVYALCRLYLAHPHAQKNLRPLRSVLKLLEGPEEQLLQDVPQMMQEAARCIRQDQPAGYETGRLLAAWLMEKE